MRSDDMRFLYHVRKHDGHLRTEAEMAEGLPS
jgi:hypothetical protein